jgi:hypothetical protein
MAFTTVDTVKQFPLGKRKRDSAGNEFIYAKGVASTAVGSWVIVDEAGVTSLLDTDSSSKGRVGVAMAVTDATTKFGWYQIYGKAVGKVLASFADEGSVFATSTGGSVDDSGAGAEVFVYGATGRSAIDTPSTGMAYVELIYPYVTGQALD